jgi:hypothetical protein
VKKLFYIAIFITFSLYGLSQVNNLHLDSLGSLTESKLTGYLTETAWRKNDNQFYSDWQKGTVVLENNERIENIYTRYRCTDDELIWLRQKDYKPAVLKKEIIKAFYYHEQGTISTFIKIDSIGILEKHTPIFAHVLHEGTFGLYVWHHRNVISSTNQVDIMDKYIFKKGKKYYQIRLNKRNILGLFPEHKKQLRKLARTKNLNMRKEEDAARFMEILNSMDL